MGHVARATAVTPRMLARALLICLFAAVWLLLCQVAADAAPGDRSGDLGVGQVARDAVASTRDAADEGLENGKPRGVVEDALRDTTAGSGDAVEETARQVDETVGRTVRQVEETGDRATEQVVRTVEGVARGAEKVADDTVGKVPHVVDETSRPVADLVHQTVEPVAPALPSAPSPQPQSGDDRTGTTERPERATAVHESLVAQENPALLVIPTVPAETLAEGAAEALSSTVVEALSSPVPASPQGPVETAPAGTSTVPGGTAPMAPAPAHAAYLGQAVPAADHELVQGVPERALVPPAERATSPGTTPD